jgi:uncharacterized protein YmfQ (DUF2313 family)
MTATDYKRALQGLLPPGPAWPREDGNVLSRLLAGLADELARVDARGLALIDEADPRTTTELLADWERVTGLVPAAGATLAQRRAAVVGQITAIGGQSRAYFIGLGANLGYTVVITEFVRHTVNSLVTAPINSTAWAYAWQVTATAGPGAATHAALEALFQALKPAHTTVFFAYP